MKLAEALARWRRPIQVADRQVAAPPRLTCRSWATPWGTRSTSSRPSRCLGAYHGRLRELALLAARALELTTDADHDHAVARAAAALDGARPRPVPGPRSRPREATSRPWTAPRSSRAPRRPEPLVADRDGVVAAFRAEEIGLASVALGAGRLRKGDPIDPAVGIVVRPKIGDRLRSGSPSARSRCAGPGCRRRGGAPGPRRDGPHRGSRRAAAARPRMDVSLGELHDRRGPAGPYLLASLFVGLAVREYARASVTARLRRSDPAAVGSDHARPEGLVRAVRQRVRAGPGSRCCGRPRS